MNFSKKTKIMKSLKLIFIFTFIIAVFSACNKVVDKSTKRQKPQIEAIPKTTTITNVNASEFKDLLDNSTDLLLVDVRTPQEYTAGHIAGAVNIDWKNQETFATKIAEISKDKTVLIYCHSGHRSGLAGKYLKEKGYTKIYNLETGIMGWKKAAFPVEK